MRNSFILFFKVIFVLIFCFINMQCYTPDPENEIELNVSFHNQECSTWCGIACIQMWADYDGFQYSQSQIASLLGIGVNDTTSPFELETGISYYTCSEGYCATKDMFVDGAQGDLIGATIYGIQDYVPAIMPYYADHAVLITGYKWTEDNGSPVAVRVFYHNPNGLPDQSSTGSVLNIWFMPCPFDYWVIIGMPYYVPEGIIGHDSFVLEGGTYYGGPSYYDPKGLLPDPDPNIN